MKILITAGLAFGMMAPVYAEAPRKLAPLFSDAPPPPLIAPAAIPACCTDTGRYSRVNPTPDKPPIEEAACEAKTAEGIKLGTICY